MLASWLRWLAWDLRVLSSRPLSAVELTPGAVDSDCHPSEVGEMRTSVMAIGALHQRHSLTLIQRYFLQPCAAYEGGGGGGTFNVIFQSSSRTKQDHRYEVRPVRGVREDLSWCWKCSTIPFTARRQVIVHTRSIPRSRVNSQNRADSNWLPRSVVMVDGTPNVRCRCGQMPWQW